MYPCFQGNILDVSLLFPLIRPHKVVHKELYILYHVLMKIISWMDPELRRMGVSFSSSLKFGDHINELVHKANRLLGLIK